MLLIVLIPRCLCLCKDTNFLANHNANLWARYLATDVYASERYKTFFKHKRVLCIFSHLHRIPSSYSVDGAVLVMTDRNEQLLPMLVSAAVTAFLVHTGVHTGTDPIVHFWGRLVLTSAPMTATRTVSRAEGRRASLRAMACKPFVHLYNSDLMAGGLC